MTYDSSQRDDLAPNEGPTELQQLEAALQAKAISPELFATLTAQLRAGATPAAPTAESPSSGGPATEHNELPSLLSLFDSPPAAAPLPAPPVPVPPPVAPTTAGAAPPPPIANPLPPARVVLPPAAAARSVVAPPTAPAPAYVAPIETEMEAEMVAPPRRNVLTTLMAVLGGAALLGVGLHLYVDQNHPSENLTGPQPAPTEEVASARISQGEAAVVALPETVRVVAAPTVVSTDSSALVAVATAPESEEAPAMELDTEESADATAAENNSAAAPTAPAPAPVPAAPEPDDDEATQKIRTVLADYYADLFAPPLAAENYFAPQVERLYIQQRLTPAQINATITQTFFPDNKKAVYQVEPGTLQVSDPAQDGSRTATYSEACRLFRVSKGRYQRLRTQVRVKFDADYRITFLRQEKMLENVFE